MLRLKDIFVVFLLMSNCFAQVEQIKSEEDFDRFVIKSSIRGWCSDHYGTCNFAELNFDKYKSSIFKVMAEALADCFLRCNEFAAPTLLEDGHIKIIEFENKNVTGYKQPQWNAVILYNYLSLVVNGNSRQLCGIRSNLRTSPREGIVYVAQKVRNHYISAVKDEALLDTFLEKAINDIHFYFRNLDLYTYLHYLINGRANAWTEQKYMCLLNVHEFKRDAKQFEIKRFYVKYNNKIYYIRCCYINIDENCVPSYRLKVWHPQKIEGKSELNVVLDEYFNITQITG